MADQIKEVYYNNIRDLDQYDTMIKELSYNTISNWDQYESLKYNMIKQWDNHLMEKLKQQSTTNSPSNPKKVQIDPELGY
jgi:hypothetical protein